MSRLPHAAPVLVSLALLGCQAHDALQDLDAQVAARLTAIDRPAQVVDLQADKAALVVVDMQDFVCRPKDGRELPGIARVVERTNALVDASRARGIPVIWLRQNFTRTDAGDDAGLYPRFHASPVSDGMFNQGSLTEIFVEMHVDSERDHVRFKNRYSAFAPGSSTLDELLKELGRSQIMFCGVATNVCVESTARDAMQRGYEVVVMSDATTTFNEVLHHASLISLRLFFGDVRSVAETIGALLPAKPE